MLGKDRSFDRLIQLLTLLEQINQVTSTHLIMRLVGLLNLLLRDLILDSFINFLFLGMSIVLLCVKVLID
jgi:hypothetical protein